MAFRPEVQARPNGPWSDEFRARASRLRETNGMSLKAFGERLGFSGPFTHGLLAGKVGHHMASKHCDKVLAAVEQMEAEAGLREMPSANDAAELSLDQLIKRIHALGFSVELKPL